MPKTIPHQAVECFVKQLKESAFKEKGQISFDDAKEVMTTVSGAHAVVPENLQIVLDEASSEKERDLIVRVVCDSIAHYEKEHGIPAPADIVNQALHCAYSTTAHTKSLYQSGKPVLDNATSQHHDALSLFPNKPVIAIQAVMAESVPFGHYLPADIGSNEAVLAVMSHYAGSNSGDYRQGDNLDGIASGGAYIGSNRIHKAAIDGTGKCTGKITSVQLPPASPFDASESCDPAGAAVKLLRGRAIVYIDGVPVAKEVESTNGAPKSPINGTCKVGGTSYLIGGWIEPDTGIFELTTSPAIPATANVVVESFIDFERMPELTPRLGVEVQTFKLYAAAGRAHSSITMDANTQMKNELGLDSYSESIIAIQQQFISERHYNALAKCARIARARSSEFNFDWGGNSAQGKSRAMMWTDLGGQLASLSQQMAIDTMNHGITHIYVNKLIAGQILSLPRDIFEPSGVKERPGIFRVGRLFGRYEVYYSPRIVSETQKGGQMLCIGRGTDVTRNPIVLGDAVAPRVVPLGRTMEMNEAVGFYYRNYTAVNPHSPSALGAAMINVTNLF